MDLPAPGEHGGAESPQEPVLLADGPPPAPMLSEREPTLAEVRAEVAALGQRVDALAGSFESAVRAAVAEEVQKVTSELQHTVATLGRVLVRDLGRLNQILRQHRDAILAELHSAPRPAAETEGPSAAGATTEATEPPPDADSGPVVPALEGRSGPPPDDEKGRNWRRRKP